MSDVSTVAVKPHYLALTHRHVIIAGAVLVLFGLAVLLYRQRAIEVLMVSPEFEDVETTVSATGNVIPTDDFAARATFSGIVDHIYVHLGQKVEAGERLVQ